MSNVATTIIRRLEPTGEAAVVLCSDAQLFPIAFVVASRLARLSDGAYDVHLLTEPNVHIERVPAECPVGIQMPDFRNRYPQQVKLDRLKSIWLMRLFAPDVLSGRYRRILYLDCDIRVEGSVGPLFRLGLEGAPLAAIDDYTLPFLPTFKPGENDRIRKRRDAVGHSATEPFFNSGVLLIDADAWRSQQMTPAAFELLGRLEALHVNDQELLNVMFRGRWMALSPRWNFTCYHDLGFESLLRPVLFHYAGCKPWQLQWDRDPAHLQAFDRQFVDTPFADYRHPKPTIGDYLKGMTKAAKWSWRNGGRLRRPGEIARHIRNAVAPQIREVFASYLIDSIRKRRFLDVRAGITELDEDAVLNFLGGAGGA